MLCVMYAVWYKIAYCLQSQDDAGDSAEDYDKDGAEAIDLLGDEGEDKKEDAEAETPGVFSH